MSCVILSVSSTTQIENASTSISPLSQIENAIHKKCIIGSSLRFKSVVSRNSRICGHVWLVDVNTHDRLTCTMSTSTQAKSPYYWLVGYITGKQLSFRLVAWTIIIDTRRIIHRIHLEVFGLGDGKQLGCLRLSSLFHHDTKDTGLALQQEVGLVKLHDATLVQNLSTEQLTPHENCSLPAGQCCNKSSHWLRLESQFLTWLDLTQYFI